MTTAQRREYADRAEATARREFPAADEVRACFYGLDVMVEVWKDGRAQVFLWLED